MPVKSRTLELSVDNRKERLVLPINPQEVAIDTASLNQHVQLLTVGEANLLGPRGLASTSLSGFFPAQGSPVGRYADRSPQSYVSTLTRWRDARKPVRLIISDMGVNLAMAIEGLQFAYREGSRDISYSIQLAEYRQLNVPTVKVAVKTKRPAVKVVSRTYTVRTGDCLWTIAKRYYGNGAKYTKIYNANRDKIRNPNLIYTGPRLVIPA